METMLLSITSKYIRNDDVAISDVIWVQTSFIGDIVLTTAAIKSLHDLLPGVRQHMVTTPTGAKVLEHHPLLASIHVFSKRDGQLSPMIRVRQSIKNLRLPHSTVILQPHKSLRSTLLSKLIGFPLHTYEETVGSWMAKCRVPRVAVFHECDRIALLLETIGLRRDQFLGGKPFLPKAKLPPIADAMTAGVNWIAVAPGSVWATKRWPMAKFASLAQMLLDKPNTGIVLLGGSDDRPAADFIEEACLRTRPEAKEKILNLAGKTSLADLHGIYPRLTQLISNDSSPIHYASAFNVPTVAIFGSTVPAMGFAPLANMSSIAEIKLDCRPCSDHGPASCPLGHFKCMNDLDVNHVRDLVEKNFKSKNLD
jgi:heptosyltransferase-2